MKKAALHNLGCKVNAYETEAMQQRLKEGGYEIVPFGEQADVYIINTCTVTNIADRKSRQMLHKAKRMNPDAIVVAAGCYVQASKEACETDEAIDIIVGNNKKKDILSIIEAFEKEKKTENTVIDINRSREYEDMPLSIVENHTRAYIKIQDGCNQFCTYCIIPYARGRVRSRRPESVIREVEKLSENGFREIVLTGIHLSSYGADFTEEQGEIRSLLGLLASLHQIPGIERIRLGSLEPRIITEEFVNTIRSLKKICPHFHLSLQSGCDSVLKRMNRRYTTKEYEEGVRLLRAGYDNPAITTDVIVGFPGETQEEFEQTRKFLESIDFFEMHIFKYSRREGTKAAAMENQIPEQIKSERSDILLKAERSMSHGYRRQWLGKEIQVLIEESVEIDGKKYQIGHTAEYVKAALEAKEDCTGKIVTGMAEGMLKEDTLLLSGWLDY